MHLWKRMGCEMTKSVDLNVLMGGASLLAILQYSAANWFLLSWGCFPPVLYETWKN